MVIWLIGKSGAGKTEIGKRLYGSLKSRLPNIVYFDGDELRASISRDLGYTKRDRYVSEERRSLLCKILSEQGIHIICSALSNAPDIRDWNKKHIADYFEIYLKSDQQVLYDRDSKGLYRRFRNGELKNVVGEDIPFYEPESPWIVIPNNGEQSPQEIVEGILSKIEVEKIEL